MWFILFRIIHAIFWAIGVHGLLGKVTIAVLAIGHSSAVTLTNIVSNYTPGQKQHNNWREVL